MTEPDESEKVRIARKGDEFWNHLDKHEADRIINSPHSNEEELKRKLMLARIGVKGVVESKIKQKLGEIHAAEHDVQDNESGEKGIG